MFIAEKLEEKGSSLKKEVDTLIAGCLFGLPCQSSTLTVRKKYNPFTWEWEEVQPHDGEGIKRIKSAIEEKWGLIPEKDFKVYSREEELDKILYIEFTGVLKIITLKANIFEWGKE